MKEHLRKNRAQDGFTLIEIIAVLVILGILAVVAVPRYFDMQTAARNSAAKGLVAAGQSQLSLSYAQYQMNPTSATVSTDASTECNRVELGGVTGGSTATLSCTGNNYLATNANINITATVGTDGSATGYWVGPGSATATNSTN
jgi:prepilin-type N-terminal cleavage/methylation domain-containing protein